MRKWILLVALLSGGFRGVAQSRDTLPPEAEIGNGVLHARFYLPDAEKGYYRATRFDWSGVMPALEYKGHHFFGQWFPKYAPTINDAIMGPVESFAPLGYEEASPGGGFVQIGVGALTRPDGAAYSAFKYYPIRKTGTWRVKRSTDRIEFRQTLDDSVYSYIYTKTVSMTPGKAELALTHTLKNTGRQVIESDVFDHNFFTVDTVSVAPGFVLKFPFRLKAEEERGGGTLAEIRGDSIVILRPFTDRESVYAVLHGYSDKADDYDIRLENHITGTGIRIRADRPLSRLVYWGSIKTLCPEPYIHVRVDPGKTFTWTIRYELYTL